MSHRSGVLTQPPQSGCSARVYTLRPTEGFPHRLPLQQAYTSAGVLPPTLADIPCRNFTALELLAELNAIIGIHVDMTNSMQAYMEGCAVLNMNFGTVYGYLRPLWGMPSHVFQNILDARLHPTFHGPRTAPGPKRIWDLYSNRVLYCPHLIPRHPLEQRHHGANSSPDIPHSFWAVSHSWVTVDERHAIYTPINDYQWPVPIPKTTTLDHKIGRAHV